MSMPGLTERIGGGVAALKGRWRSWTAGRRSGPAGKHGEKPEEQELDVYWDPKFAQVLETWGEGNAWNEIQLLLLTGQGRVLDLACGTGKVMDILGRFPALDVYGCDISDLLIRKAVERGLRPDRLAICDATRTAYADSFFDYGYSIGSLEHFAEDGIPRFVAECHRVVRKSTFHQLPVARDGRDHGWIRRRQSYFNNSVDWWRDHFRASYRTVHVLDSSWQDDISVGKWFVCMREPVENTK